MVSPASRLIESRGIPAPRGLEALTAVLKLVDRRPIAPDDATRGLHPLMVPLSLDKAGAVSGVLLLPGAQPADPLRFVPVATVPSTNGALRPLGETCGTLTRRLLAELDRGSDPAAPAAIEAAAAAGVIYSAGEAKLANPFARYLLPTVGPFLDIYEQLAEGHLARGDDASALITCERAERAYDEWGLPFAAHARMHEGLSRAAEARDGARVALSKPFWSLGAHAADLASLVALAGYDAPRVSREWFGAVRHIDRGEMRHRAQEMGLPAPALSESDFVAALPFLAPAEHSWDSVRDELADTFDAEGRPELARWIKGS
jgi:hypothetical protein